MAKNVITLKKLNNNIEKRDTILNVTRNHVVVSSFLIHSFQRNV